MKNFKGQISRIRLQWTAAKGAKPAEIKPEDIAITKHSKYSRAPTTTVLQMIKTVLKLYIFFKF